MTHDDGHWMQLALRLAEQGRGAVEPNPLVGAVLVHDGELLGQGWHERFGGPHAEVNALASVPAEKRGRLTGATLYVTLEPCCHHGKTPPCTDAILRHGVRRVVAALADPFPQVAGRGAELLRQAGVDVVVGVEEAAAQRLNAPYLKLLATQSPYVHLKWAMSLDGKIATRTGESQWISGEQSRQRVHQLRGCMDAIIVGVGTALADDPLLTARPAGPRNATRIVFDGRLRIPTTSKLVASAREVPTLIATTNAAPRERANALRSNGCEVMVLPTKDNRPDPLALLSEMGQRRFTNVLVEGGAALLGSFVDARAVDAVHVFIATKLIGGVAAPGAVAGTGIERLRDGLTFDQTSVQTLGDDLYVHASGLSAR